MYSAFYQFQGGRGTHSVAIGKVRRFSSCFVNLSCVWAGLVLFPQIGFCFVGLLFIPSASWRRSFLVSLPLFFLSTRPCLIHARLVNQSSMSCALCRFCSLHVFTLMLFAMFYAFIIQISNHINPLRPTEYI